MAALPEKSELVSTVVESVPETAVNRGVWTELALAERFARVRTVARRVALIDESGGRLSMVTSVATAGFSPARSGLLAIVYVSGSGVAMGCARRAVLLHAGPSTLVNHRKISSKPVANKRITSKIIDYIVIYHGLYGSE